MNKGANSIDSKLNFVMWYLPQYQIQNHRIELDVTLGKMDCLVL